MRGIEVAASNGKQDAMSLLKLASALETAARIADNLDGLAHLQAVEMAFAKRVDAETMAQRLQSVSHETDANIEDEWEPPAGCITIVD